MELAQRKLASVQRIESLASIPDADAIEVATVLGWHVVVRKGEFRVGDPCVYAEIDSVLPDRPEFEFLRERHFRIKTIKLRGQVSQGIVFPLSVLGGRADPKNLSIGDDVSGIIGVLKYEPVLPAALTGEAIGLFPGFLHKTDEMRIQAFPGVLERNRGVECYVTEKLDGASMTIYHFNGDVGVCSRNINLRDTPQSLMWRVAHACGLPDKLRTFGKNIALQGELIGSGVQGNRLGLKGNQFLVFSVWDIMESHYVGRDGMNETLAAVGYTETVPSVEDYLTLDYSVDDLVAHATGKSALNANVHREGIVIRAIEETPDLDLGRLSFKVCNPDYLLRYGE